MTNSINSKEETQSLKQSSTPKSIDAATYVQIAKELVEYKLKIDRYFANTLMKDYSWLFGLSTYGVIVIPAFIDQGYISYENGHLFFAPELTDHSGTTESEIKQLMLYDVGKDIKSSAGKMAKLLGHRASQADKPEKGVQFKVYLPALCQRYEKEIIQC